MSNTDKSVLRNYMDLGFQTVSL